MDNSEILKSNIARRIFKRDNGPAPKQKYIERRRQGRVARVIYEKELQFFIDRYNLQKGTDFEPLFKKLVK